MIKYAILIFMSLCLCLGCSSPKWVVESKEHISGHYEIIYISTSVEGNKVNFKQLVIYMPDMYKVRVWKWGKGPNYETIYVDKGVYDSLKLDGEYKGSLTGNPPTPNLPKAESIPHNQFDEV